MAFCPVWSSPSAGQGFCCSSGGSAEPHSGSYAYAISNHENGNLSSDPIPVTPDTEYDLYAHMRGELDPDDSEGSWLIRARFIDASGAGIGSQDVASGGPGTLDTTWREEGGTFIPPAGTATVRILLWNLKNSGWVAYDDVRLVSEEQVTKYYYLGGQRVATLHPTCSGVVCAAEACYTICTAITWDRPP